MKFIDREGRLFGKISVIDVLAIAVVLVLAAALFTKATRTETSPLITEETITFQVMARGLEDYVADAIQTGDFIYDDSYSSGGRPVGKIIDVQVVREVGQRMVGNLPGGEAAYIDAEGTKDLLITVQGSGVQDGKSYAINRVYALGLNSSRTYYTKHASFPGMVFDIF